MTTIRELGYSHSKNDFESQVLGQVIFRFISEKNHPQVVFKFEMTEVEEKTSSRLNREIRPY
jgi:hypothetical protein